MVPSIQNGILRKYLADPNAVGNVNTVLLASELTILEPPLPNDPGTMELSDSMRVSTSGDFKLDGTIFSDKGDCTPPDLNVIDSIKQSLVFYGGYLSGGAPAAT